LWKKEHGLNGLITFNSGRIKRNLGPGWNRVRKRRQNQGKDYSFLPEVKEILWKESGRGVKKGNF